MGSPPVRNWLDKQEVNDREGANIQLLLPSFTLLPAPAPSGNIFFKIPFPDAKNTGDRYLNLFMVIYFP